MQAWKQKLIYLGHVIPVQSTIQVSTALVLMHKRLFRDACFAVCLEQDLHLWSPDDHTKLTVSFSALTPDLPFPFLPF